MQSIKENIHIENKYTGVTLGAINFPRGLIYIDAPLTPEDGRSWRTDLLDLEYGHERLLINLNANLDRIIGARMMETKILAHKNLAVFLRNRSGILKAQAQGVGAEWENIPNLANIRWAPPHLTFTKKMTIHWGESPIIFEHHPGPDKSAIWVILPEEKVVFVGDTILKNQPPFFADANISQWAEDLKLLTSEAYKGYAIISGRGGTCALSTIEKQQEIIETAHTKLAKLASKNADVEEIETLIPALLEPLRFLASESKMFEQRLRYGLTQYYIQHYLTEKDE